MFFNVVVHAVLFFGLDTWVLTPHMGRALGSFQHGVASQIMGIQLKIQEEGDWEYPLMEAVMEEAGFEEIGDYILKRQNRVANTLQCGQLWDSARGRCGGWGAGFLGYGGKRRVLA